ncbi:hypothetical protein FW781_18445 [Chryseobacterium panacisoli]|uniref:Nuclear transport factor 2 family protein n=1 Tax=Chryseobacterium panacisoli TaxID=1807141 RepID=A0A5D8ZI37_9FLAO|nr:hypothetical protein [Chryseobacterium panacisoli]TZF93672.1 hypothetical protein FW781_18445 [Chryseobacterium panacisoli]
MRTYKLIIIFLTGFSCITCGQNTNKKKENLQPQLSKKQQIMDLSKITDPEVKKAIEALQNGDKSWYSFFTENPAMTDDGRSIDFQSFFSNALGNEMFLSIDRVENDGKNIYGNFKAGKWGTFQTYFKFHKNAEGKFDKLDIGQAR